MHLRFSMCEGMRVLEEGTEEPLGTVADILVNPDSGKVEGFFVDIAAPFRKERHFVSSVDVTHIGKVMRVRSREILAPPEELLRIQPLLEDGRKVRMQKIRTESGRALGRCRDVQFSTDLLQIEWLFPKRFWQWQTAIPLSEVIEVKNDAIIVKDPAAPALEPARGEPALA